MANSHIILFPTETTATGVISVDAFSSLPLDSSENIVLDITKLSDNTTIVVPLVRETSTLYKLVDYHIVNPSTTVDENYSISAYVEGTSLKSDPYNFTVSRTIPADTFVPKVPIPKESTVYAGSVVKVRMRKTIPDDVTNILIYRNDTFLGNPYLIDDNTMEIIDWDIPVGTLVYTARLLINGAEFISSDYYRIYSEILPLPPYASFTADNIYGYAPLTVQFTDTSSNYPTQWHWDFGGDIYYNTVMLLLQSDNISGSLDFRDNGKDKNILSVNGVVVNSNVKAVFINTSIYFNNGSIYITPANATSNFDLSTAEFTLEFMMNVSAVPSISYIFSGYDNTNSTDFYVAVNNIGSIVLSVGGIILQSTGHASIIDGNWHYISCLRKQGLLYIYVDGVERASVSYNYAINLSGNNINIGKTSRYPNNYYIGYISEMRLTRAIPRPAVAPTIPYYSFIKSTSTLQNPIFTYTSPGKYDVTLTVSNSEGEDTFVNTEFITVLSGLPVVNFTADIVTPAPAELVSFTDLTTNGAIYWYWDFGDNQYSSLKNPGHIYTTVGKYTVTLTVTNTYGSRSLMKLNYIDVADVTTNSILQSENGIDTLIMENGDIIIFEV